MCGLRRPTGWCLDTKAQSPGPRSRPSTAPSTTPTRQRQGQRRLPVPASAPASASICAAAVGHRILGPEGACPREPAVERRPAVDTRRARARLGSAGDLAQRRDPVVAFEVVTPGEKSKGDEPEGEPIRRRGDLLAPDGLLGGHVAPVVHQDLPGRGACPVRSPSILAMPKSRIFTMGGKPSRSARNQVLGFRSRSTIPSPCALSSAEANCASQSSAWAVVGDCSRQKPFEVVPLEQLHHEKRGVVELPAPRPRHDPDDMLALHRAVDTRLPAKPLDEIGRQQRSGEHQLQCQPLPVLAWTTS